MKIQHKDKVKGKKESCVLYVKLKNTYNSLYTVNFT